MNIDILTIVETLSGVPLVAFVSAIFGLLLVAVFGRLTLPRVVVGSVHVLVHTMWMACIVTNAIDLLYFAGLAVSHTYSLGYSLGFTVALGIVFPLSLYTWLRSVRELRRSGHVGRGISLEPFYQTIVWSLLLIGILLFASILHWAQR